MSFFEAVQAVVALVFVAITSYAYYEPQFLDRCVAELRRRAPLLLRRLWAPRRTRPFFAPRPPRASRLRARAARGPAPAAAEAGAGVAAAAEAAPAAGGAASGADGRSGLRLRQKRAGQDAARATRKRTRRAGPRGFVDERSDDDDDDDDYESAGPRFRNEIVPHAVYGLYNAGNTCFINSVLQGLATLSRLPEYLDDVLSRRDQPWATQAALPVTEALLDTVLALNEPVPYDGRKAFCPNALIQALASNRRVTNHEQQDAQEFFQIVASGVENEDAATGGGWGELGCVRSPFCADAVRRRPKENCRSNCFGKKLITAENAAKSFSPRSPFFGLQASRFSCVQCGYTAAIRHFTFNSLSLTLPTSTRCSLESCLRAFTSIEVLHDCVCRRCTLAATLIRIKLELSRASLQPYSRVGAPGDASNRGAPNRGCGNDATPVSPVGANVENGAHDSSHGSPHDSPQVSSTARWLPMANDETTGDDDDEQLSKTIARRRRSSEGLTLSDGKASPQSPARPEESKKAALEARSAPSDGAPAPPPGGACASKEREAVLEAMRRIVEALKMDVEREIENEDGREVGLNLRPLWDRVFLKMTTRCATKQVMIAKPPDVLCLHVSRSTYTPYGVAIKNGCVVSFPEYLDIAPYTTTGELSLKPDGPISLRTENGSDECFYRLMSVIVHYGSHTFGHFVAYRRRRKYGDTFSEHCDESTSGSSSGKADAENIPPRAVEEQVPTRCARGSAAGNDLEDSREVCPVGSANLGAPKPTNGDAGDQRRNEASRDTGDWDTNLNGGRKVAGSEAGCSEDSDCDPEDELFADSRSWYRISDDQVEFVSLAQVLLANPYMLLYERVRDSDREVPPLYRRRRRRGRLRSNASGENTAAAAEAPGDFSTPPSDESVDGIGRESHDGR